MAADIVPELYEKIEKEFTDRVDRFPKIKQFYKKLEEEKATAEDVSIYAADLGDCAAAALANNLTEDVLPDGRMYWNIADRTVKPLLKIVFKMVMDAAIRQQEIEDKKSGIGMKAVSAEFPENKINDLIFKFSEIFDEAADE